MSFDLKTVFSQIFLTLRDPRAGARWAIGLGIGRRQAWELLFAVILVSVVLAGVLSITLGGSVEGSGLLGPFGLTVAQAIFLWLLIQLIDKVGRSLGGKGTLSQAIVLVAWMQIVLLVVQVAVLILLQVLPLGSGLVSVIGFVAFFWLLTNFVAELHGFKSRPLIFLAVLAGLFAIAMMASIVLTFMGITISGSI